MTQDQILSKLRVTYKLDPADYPDEILIEAIGDSCKKISEYYPEIELDSSMVTVAEQTRYTVDTSEDGIPSLLKLIQVFYMQGVNTVNDVFNDPDLPPAISPSRYSTFLPSTLYEQIQSLEIYRKLRPAGADIVSWNKFDLLPTPSTSGDPLYFEYARYRTIDEIPPVFEENVYQLIFYYLNEPTSQKTINDAKTSKYHFERRGNITVERDVQEALREKRERQIATIIKSIQSKVMKM